MERSNPNQVRAGAVVEAKHARNRNNGRNDYPETEYSIIDRLVRAHLRQSIRHPILMTVFWSLSYIAIFIALVIYAGGDFVVQIGAMDWLPAE